MPVFVGEERIGKDYKSSSELLERFPKLKIKSQEFVSQPTTQSFQDENMLYIGQSEYGTVHPSDTSVTVIGSDSATTCQIVVLRNSGSGVCSLAHFDGLKIGQALEDMMKTLTDFSEGGDQNRIELYVIGGFLDDRGISEDIFLQILNGAAQLSANVELVCACVCALNDRIVNGRHIPKIYGIGVFVSSGKIVPVQQFQCAIPDQSLRHVALWTRDEKRVRQVYSSRTQELTVNPFQLIFPAEEARVRAALPDAVILQYFSTSPHCEPPNFVSNLKAAYLFVSENPNILEKFFPERKPRRFKRQNNGKWCLIEQPKCTDLK